MSVPPPAAEAPPFSPAKKRSSPSRSRSRSASRKIASDSCSAGSGAPGCRWAICRMYPANSAFSMDSAPMRWKASGSTFLSSSTSSCLAMTGWSSALARAAGSCRSSACRIAMKWLLPEPNEPARNAPRLTPEVSASATSPSAASNASASAGVTTYSSTVRAIAPGSMLSVSRST